MQRLRPSSATLKLNEADKEDDDETVTKVILMEEDVVTLHSVKPRTKLGTSGSPPNLNPESEPDVPDPEPETGTVPPEEKKRTSQSSEKIQESEPMEPEHPPEIDTKSHSQSSEESKEPEPEPELLSEIEPPQELDTNSDPESSHEPQEPETAAILPNTAAHQEADTNNQDPQPAEPASTKKEIREHPVHNNKPLVLETPTPREFERKGSEYPQISTPPGPHYSIYEESGAAGQPSLAGSSSDLEVGSGSIISKPRGSTGSNITSDRSNRFSTDVKSVGLRKTSGNGKPNVTQLPRQSILSVGEKKSIKKKVSHGREGSLSPSIWNTQSITILAPLPGSQMSVLSEVNVTMESHTPPPLPLSLCHTPVSPSEPATEEPPSPVSVSADKICTLSSFQREPTDDEKCIFVSK